MHELLHTVKERILSGGSISFEEAVQLAETAPRMELYAAADEIRRHFCDTAPDTCSIVNARSGKCSENCKWCAQSAHYHTGVATYPIISTDEVMAIAQANDKRGIDRFSLVTSGRAVSMKDMPEFCKLFRQIGESTGLQLCASMGLLGRSELQMLKDTGVKRYHCNLETSASFFPSLCTTHTPEEKKETIRLAKEVGLEVCSGGIIGMGETMTQRIELAFELAELGVVSVPMNILCPIKGTALEHTAPISDEDILVSIAIFRLILPRTVIRFAGGRARLPRHIQRQALQAGLNGLMVGDLLTTHGSQADADKQLFDEAGYDISQWG